MKQSKTAKSNLSYKNHPTLKLRMTRKSSGIISEIKLLLTLVGILSFFVIAENFPFLVSLIKPIGVHQALAIEEVPDAASFLPPTPTPVSEVLFSINTLSSSPTPSPTPVNQEPPAGDFCLNVPIFMYHHVQPMQIANELGHGQLTVDSEMFDQHMTHLLSLGYTMISSEEVVRALIDHRQLPEKSIVIAIDDGYDDNYDYAYQTAKKYNIKMDFMIPTGLIENSGYMTWGELKEMAQNPLIKIYNHTWSHAAVGALDKDTIIKEVTQANKQLEEQLGIKNPIFVYPYGSFSPLAIETLKEQGFIAGITTIQGTLQCKSRIMELQRTRIGNAPLSYFGF